MRRIPCVLVAAAAVAAASPGSAQRTVAAPVEEYLGPLRAGAPAPYEPASIRLLRRGPDGGTVETISSERVGRLLAPCVLGDRSYGPLSPANRRQFRIRQQWRCEGADGYAGIVATFITSPRAERLESVELELRDQPFAPPSPPPSWPGNR